MRNGNLLFSAVQFLIVLTLFCLGLAFLGIHYMPHIRYEIADWIIRSQERFEMLGYLVLGTALLLTICLWAMQRHQYLRIGMKRKHVLVDEGLVKKTILYFWKQSFPSFPKPSEIYFAKQKIEVIAPLPKGTDLEKTLPQMEQLLGELLEKQFGYEREFFITFRK